MKRENLYHKQKQKFLPKTKEDKWDFRRFLAFIFILLSASLFFYLNSDETIKTKEKDLTLSSGVKLISSRKGSSQHLVFYVKEKRARFEVDQYGILSMEKQNTYTDFMSLSPGSVLHIKYAQSLDDDLNYVIINAYGLRANNKIFFSDHDYIITSNKAYKNWFLTTLIISIFSTIYYFRKSLLFGLRHKDRNGKLVKPR